MSGWARAAALATLACALLGLLSPGPRATAPQARTVVLLTVDGARWDFPDRGKLPNFARLAKEGFRAGRLVPPFPSLTFVSHATLATGCYPDKHGIAANSFLDRKSNRRFSMEAEASWLLEPPLWAWAVQHGRAAGVARWPTSAGPWRGLQPSPYLAYAAPGGEGATVEWLLGQLRRPAAERPALLMAWTGGPDHEAHEEGPASAAVDRAMRGADKTVGRLLDALAPLRGGVTLFVVSDHGMAPVAREVDLVSRIPKRGFFPFVSISGPLCNVYCKGEKQLSQTERALRGSGPGVQMWRREKLPAGMRYGGERVGDLVLLAPPGTTFRGYAATKEGRLEAPPMGMHGYDPAACPEMGGIFYAWGEGVSPRASLAEVSAVDVAPTACALLGLPPLPNADGKVLALGGR